MGGGGGQQVRVAEGKLTERLRNGSQRQRQGAEHERIKIRCEIIENI